jgi:hypothetical protein
LPYSTNDGVLEVSGAADSVLWWGLLDGFDLVAEANYATLDDVGAETASVNK